MSTHLTIITGASRGMGLCMAQQLLARHHSLLCISRNTSTTLALAATQAQATERLTQWTADLAEPAPVAERLANWLASQAGKQVAAPKNYGKGKLKAIEPAPGRYVLVRA